MNLKPQWLCFSHFIKYLLFNWFSLKIVPFLMLFSGKMIFLIFPDFFTAPYIFVLFILKLSIRAKVFRFNHLTTFAKSVWNNTASAAAVLFQKNRQGVRPVCIISIVRKNALRLLKFSVSLTQRTVKVPNNIYQHLGGD